MAEDKGAGKDGAKDSKAGAPTQQPQTASQFVASLSAEQRKEFLVALASTPDTAKKPIKKVKFRVVATRLGFDGLTLRHPGKKFTMDINVNDDWPDWVVKEEDYVPPPKEDEDEGDGEGGAQRVQIRGGVKAGNSVVI
jgi:hypothetical protein